MRHKCNSLVYYFLSNDFKFLEHIRARSVKKYALPDTSNYFAELLIGMICLQNVF